MHIYDGFIFLSNCAFYHHDFITDSISYPDINIAFIYLFILIFCLCGVSSFHILTLICVLIFKVYLL